MRWLENKTFWAKEIFYIQQKFLDANLESKNGINRLWSKNGEKVVSSIAYPKHEQNYALLLGAVIENSSNFFRNLNSGPFYWKTRPLKIMSTYSV